MSVKKESAVTHCHEFTWNASDKKLNPILIDEAPHFIAIEVCDLLGLSNVTKALLALDDDERLTLPLVRSGQKRKMNLVTESGFYGLIFRSNMPFARQVRKWVTNEVLPAIRRNGHYKPAAVPSFRLEAGDPAGDPLRDPQALSALILQASKIAGTQRAIAKFMGVSESVFTDIRNRPWKITDRLKSKVDKVCRQVVEMGKVPPPDHAALTVPELGSLLFDVACIDNQDLRRRLARKIMRLSSSLSELEKGGTHA